MNNLDIANLYYFSDTSSICQIQALSDKR